MDDSIIENLDEDGRWHARDVSYWGGRWDQVQQQLPRFRTVDFKAAIEGPSNPYMKSVVRLPRTQLEQPVPVGTVSNTYTLAQHADVAEKCLQGVRESGIDTDDLRCELGLTELGEWMNLRIYFPDKFSHYPADQHKLALRLECFNSVDGTSRLVVLLGWLRFVCSNGMVIGETKTELRDIHNKHMDLQKIPRIICDALNCVQEDLQQITSWENQLVKQGQIEPWVNKIVPNHWGKKASCRVYHICQSGKDVEITDPFAKGEVVEKPVKIVQAVPGATAPALNLYDVSQALSWVASNRTNSDERVEWQSQIPDLIERLAVIA